MTLEESYEIYNNYYQNIYGMYDDNWIDYDLDVAFTKLQLEKIIQKRYKLDHQEKMILQWLLEEDMEPNPNTNRNTGMKNLKSTNYKNRSVWAGIWTGS